MKLQLLDNLETVPAKRTVKSPCMTVSFTATPLEPLAIMPTRYEFKTSAEFSFVQNATDDAPMNILHSQATRAIMRNVYGPVYNELMAIRETLWADGYTGDAVSKVDELLDCLSAR